MGRLDILKPPQTKGHASVVKQMDQWFIACTSNELRHKPLARTVQGTPLVIFRQKHGEPAALVDR